jgi:hypothetical protein
VETDNWKFIEARWYKKFIGDRHPRLIVVHDMEFYERGDSAEVIANDFATRPPTSKASAHICVDNNSIVQCVKDNDIAYAAPGGNSDGLQMELAGFGKQTRADWLDFYGIALLALGSDAAAQWALKFGIPPIHLTDAQVADKVSRGICGHDQVSRVFKLSDHTDPGPNFPWEYFIQSTLNFYNVRKHRVAA